MGIELSCAGCGRKIKINKYISSEKYFCAKCRGIEIPKKVKIKEVKQPKFGGLK